MPPGGRAPGHRPPAGRVPADLLPLGADGRPLSRRRPSGIQSNGADGSAPPPLAPAGWPDPAQAAAALGAGAPAAGPQPQGAAVRRLVRDHQVFLTVLLAATVIRVIAMVGYPPALWYPDSLPYVHAALHPAPYRIRPVGYSFMLGALRPFHSFMLVIAVQHAMGIAAGTAAYVLLRRRFRLPAWAATLAVIPPLLSAYTIQIEHFVLSDALFGFFVTIAVVLLLWRAVPPVWICALAGLLLSGAALARSEGLPLLVPFCVYLLTLLRSKRVIAGILAMGVTFAVPVLGYARWFDRTYGTFQLTTSSGAFLYGRVSTFADCSVINPPADERWLCLPLPASKRSQSPQYYVWASQSPIQHGPGWEFGTTVNRLATDFDRRAILAQPFDYLKVVVQSTLLSFHPDSTQIQYLFPAQVPESLQALAARNDESYQDGYTFDRGSLSTRLVEPFAGLARGYQRFAVVPGWLLAVIVLTGLTGLAAAWRRFGGPTLLPWLAGLVLLVTPAATAGFSARYVVATVPLFCIAAAIGGKETADYFPARQPGQRQGSLRPAAVDVQPARIHRSTSGPVPGEPGGPRSTQDVRRTGQSW